MPNRQPSKAFCDRTESLEDTRGGRNGGHIRCQQQPSNLDPCQRGSRPSPHRNPRALHAKAGLGQPHPQTQMRGKKKKTILQKTLKTGNLRGETLYHWFTITGLANMSHSEEGQQTLVQSPPAQLNTGRWGGAGRAETEALHLLSSWDSLSLT